MGRTFLWSWVGVSLLLLQVVATYPTVSEESVCTRYTGSLAWLYLEPAQGGAALLNFSSRPRHTGCSLVVLPTADYLLQSTDYLMSVRLVPRDDASPARSDARRHGDCSLKVMPPHSLRPTWELDLCNHSSLGRVLLMRDYFPHAAILSWDISRDSRDYLQASGILLSFVGKGSDECSKPDMVPCVKRGASTLLCVSSKLACDGQVNCPVGGFDEDQELCRQKNSSPSQHADRDKQRATYPAVQDYDDQDSRLRDSSDSLAKALSHYGPWGYLMLGTLLCGALLMACGLWECCCRGKANTRRATGLVPPQPPAAVYIISGPEAPAMAPAPPSYEDLDQPPDYRVLFPADKDKDKDQPATTC